MTRRLCMALLALLLPAAASAQMMDQAQAPPLTLRGVPAGQPTGQDLPLSLADAVHRGLDHNLAAIVQEQSAHAASSARLQALSALLPHVSAGVRESGQVINTAAFGFSGFNGIPNLIGPFPLFDARVYLSTPLFDAGALNDLRAQNALVSAAGFDTRQVRDTVVLAVANVYFEALADAARVTSAQAEVTTAESLVTNAQDQEANGLIADIDVVRQRVQLQSARARLITAENELDKRKLVLARSIGLPANQVFHLSDTASFKAAPEMTLDAAVAEATAHRDDVKAAEARVAAARATRASAVSAVLPSLHLDADIGKLGPTPSEALKTYTVTASVKISIFEGGSTRAKIQDADATLRQREAEAADLEAGVRYDVTTALLDVKAAAANVDVAQSGQALARQELEQAQDRFRSGVATSLELVQAQESLSRADEQYISSIYAHTIAKAALARALGDVETRFLDFVGGQP